MLKIEIIGDNTQLKMELSKDVGYEHMYSHVIISLDVRMNALHDSGTIRLMRMDVDPFVQSLKRFIANNGDRVELFSMDEQIYLRGIKIQSGTIHWKGTVKSLMNPENQFSFDFLADLDQIKIDNLERWNTAPMRSDM